MTVTLAAEHESLHTTTYLGNQKQWDHVGDEVLHVFRAGCADFLDEETLQAQQIRLQNDVSDPGTTNCLLRERADNTLIGFTSFYNAGVHFKQDAACEQERLDRGFSKNYFAAIQAHTAAIGWTVLLPEKRHKGGWSTMMHTLEAELYKADQFNAMIRRVRTAGSYAAHVRSRYAPGIIYESTFEQDFGKQRYFRVDLQIMRLVTGFRQQPKGL